MTLTKSFIHGSISREYKIYIPASYSSATPVPLVLNLHGYGSDMAQQEVYGDFRAIADTAGFIVVHPNGTYDGTFKRYWEAYGLSTVDDLGFLSALIDTISITYNIDQNRIYSTGLSNGAIMSYYLACNLSNKIAAIASVTGTMTTAMKSSCNATHPTPVMEIHGTADAVVPYAGNATFMHVDSVVKFWRTFNSISASALVTPVPDINTSDGCTATRYDYNDGTSQTSVSLYKIINGGHTWPGAPVNVGVTNHDFSASIEIWKFFREYRLNVLSDVEKKQKESSIVVYPNPASDYISFKNISEGKLQIIDIQGRIVFEKVVEEKEENIDIRSYPAGIYLVKISNKGMYQTIKFSKR